MSTYRIWKQKKAIMNVHTNKRILIGYKNMSQNKKYSLPRAHIKVALWYFLLKCIFFSVKNLRSKSILSFSYSNIITLLPMHDYLDRHAAPLQFADEVSAFVL